MNEESLNYKLLKEKINEVTQLQKKSYRDAEKEIGVLDGFISRLLNGRLQKGQRIFIPKVLSHFNLSLDDFKDTESENVNLSYSLRDDELRDVDPELLSECFSRIIKHIRTQKSKINLDKIIVLVFDYYRYSRKEGLISLDDFLMNTYLSSSVKK